MQKTLGLDTLFRWRHKVAQPALVPQPAEGFRRRVLGAAVPCMARACPRDYCASPPLTSILPRDRGDARRNHHLLSQERRRKAGRQFSFDSSHPSSKLARRWCAGAAPRRPQRRARFRGRGFAWSSIPVARPPRSCKSPTTIQLTPIPEELSLVPQPWGHRGADRIDRPMEGRLLLHR